MRVENIEELVCGIGPVNYLVENEGEVDEDKKGAIILS